VEHDATASAAPTTAVRNDSARVPGPANQPTNRPTSTDSSAAFPGGRAKLPKVDPLTGEPCVEFVDTAFREPETISSNGDSHRGTFADYFSNESLFEEPDRPIIDRLEAAPYKVLGLGREASWNAIVAAHRKLAKANHPDRMLGATPAQIADAIDRLLEINEAYSELERRKRG
jgi:hypothetical protein